MLAGLLFFWQKVNCTSESPSPAVCTFNSRASCGFFVIAVMSLFSESNAHCEVAEVYAKKNTILRLIDVLRTGAGKPAIFW